MIYLPGLVDKRMKACYRGEIVCISAGKHETVAYVYGKTLAEMRRRKGVMADALREREKEADDRLVCTCPPSCTICKGECGCKYCEEAYADFLSSRVD